MAVTDTGHDATRITRFYGLSTETKPENPMIGATFYETNTRRTFVYGDEWVLTEKITADQAAAIQVEDLRSTDDLLMDILIQLRIQNAHLALVNSEVLTEEDMEDDNN